MIQLGTPFTAQEISAAFAKEWEAVHAVFGDIPAEQFFQAPEGVWSPADNLVHLIKSAHPIVAGLRLPKFIIQLRYGKATGPSAPLAKIRRRYMAEADEGRAVASGPYLPEVKEKTVAERERILGKWLEKGEGMVKNLSKWKDRDLDSIKLPHPVIGDITLREMLFFTLYHNLHHVNDVCRLLDRPEQEWFE